MKKNTDGLTQARGKTAEASAIGMLLLLYDDEGFLRRVMSEARVWRVPIQQDLSSVDDGSTLLWEDEDTAHAIYCPADSMLTFVSKMREELPTAGIVVLSSLTDGSPMSGLSLFSGADAFFSPDALPLEVVAALQALRRRGEAFLQYVEEGASENATDLKASAPEYRQFTSPNKEKQSLWYLSDDGWMLTAPSGNYACLTRIERAVMMALVESSPGPLKREDLLALMNSEADLSQLRYVDGLIARLRNKFARMGETLPVRSVRGVGYLFVNVPDAA